MQIGLLTNSGFSDDLIRQKKKLTVTRFLCSMNLVEVIMKKNITIVIRRRIGKRSKNPGSKEGYKYFPIAGGISKDHPYE